MSLPNIQVIGNIRKPQTRYLPTGKEVTSFTIECSEKNAKGEYDNLYLKGEVWEKQSQFFNQYFKDGSVAIVTGKLVTNVYEKQDGTKQYENKLLFPSVSFAPKEKQSQQANSNPPPQANNYNQSNRQPNPNQRAEYIPEMDVDEELPF